ncbi:MAG: NAD-dependent epimerase/dehydratase family protein [Sulfuriferula sp.]|nr:NAD-dependent epimerase/dehydratase family protein [Sulfuriferula sp.]
MRVLVTGSSSHLARALLPLLCNHASIQQVTGIDIQPAVYQHPKFTAIQDDLTRVDLSKLLHQHDGLIHLAFIVLRGKTPITAMRAINISATQRLFDTAVALGIAHIVHLSSASVYGDGVMLQEDAPLRPIAGFLYAQHKTELEHWLIANHPHICRLRPHIILGQHAQTLLVNILRQPFYVKLPDPQPQLQVVHENDVARAILTALLNQAQGAYNLASNPCFSFRDAIKQRHRYAIAVSPRLAKSALNLIWRTTGIGGEIGWIDGVHNTLTLNCSKAQRVLGWQAENATQDILLGNVMAC